LLSTPTLAAAAQLLTAAVLALVLGLELRKLLARMPTLTSISGVIAFKRAVAVQMYGSLAVLLLTVGAICTAGAGLYRGLSGWNESPVLIAVAAVLALVGAWTRMIEARATRIPVVDDDIGRQRDAVVRTWKRRMLPNWRTHWE
jgi:hypothetical protein